MKIELQTDHGSVLKPDEAALVWSPRTGFTLLLPQRKGDEEVPEAELLLAAILVRLGEDEFRADLLAQFEQNTTAS